MKETSAEQKLCFPGLALTDGQPLEMLSERSWMTTSFT